MPVKFAMLFSNSPTFAPTEETKLDSVTEDGFGDLDIDTINDGLLNDFKLLGISNIDKLNEEVEIDMDAWELDEGGLYN